MLRLIRAHVLQYYVLREYLKSFALAAIACTLFMLLATFFLRAAELEGFGVSVGQVALLSPFFIPYVLTYSIPLAAMIAAILVFGRLTAENEILAAQAGGASILMLSLPIMFCGAVFSFCTLWCNDQGIEWGFLQVRYHLTNLENPKLVKKLNQPGNNLPLPLEGGGMAQINMLPYEKMENGQERRPLHIVCFSRGRMLHNLYARHHEFSKPYRTPEIEGLRMDVKLFDGQSLGDDPYYFDATEFSLDLPSLASKLRQGSGQESLVQNWKEAWRIRASIIKRRAFLIDRSADLAAQIVAGNAGTPSGPALCASMWAESRKASDLSASAKRKARQKMVEFHRKLALSFMPFSLVVLGIGLGLLVRKSNRLVGFVLGILAYVLVYYPLMVIFKELANADQVPGWALWAPNVLLFTVGWGLWRAYERGYMGGGPPPWLHDIGDAVRERALPLWQLVSSLELSSLMPFRRRTDRFIAGAFLVPLLVISLATGVLLILLDIVEHGGEVLNGLIKADKPLGWLPARSFARALWDVFVFYGIRGLGMMFDLLPAMFLLAGTLTVTVFVRNNEHLILKSSGVPLQKAFRPLLLLSVALALTVTLVRETIMPGLIMERDRLKPLVYHRSPKSKSIAGQTKDAEGRTVMFEIAQYSRNLRICEGLHIYSPSEAREGEIVPRIIADSAVWDQKNRRWLLRTENRDGSIHTLSLAEKDIRYDPHGLLVKSSPEPPKPGGAKRLSCSNVISWDGTLSPAYLESQSLGPSVMPLFELWRARHRPEFASELWRRGLEWLTGMLLLMCTIPLLVSQEIRSPLVGIAQCILYGAAYLGANLACAEAARQELFFVWAPALPHLIFLAMGVRRYFFTMET